MSSIDNLTAILKLLADQTRLRILAILDGTELTVKEMTEILQVGQSTLSTQLGQLKDAGLLAARKQGQFVFYRIPNTDQGQNNQELCTMILHELPKAEWYERDRRQVFEILERRREASISYFNTQKSQNQSSPGQTMQSLILGLVQLIHDQDIVDLGCGIGRLAAQLAQSGNRVTGIDNSPEQISVAQNLNRSVMQHHHLIFQCAPMEQSGLPAASYDSIIISQALHHAAKPQDVLVEASRLLRPKGRLLVIDLVRHEQDWIQDKFADFWLGFDTEELAGWLRIAGFQHIHHQIGIPDPDYPQIEPLIITAIK